MSDVLAEEGTYSDTNMICLSSGSCEFRMIVNIKPVNKHTIRNDKMVATHPYVITIRGDHNHSTGAAAALKELRVLPHVRRNFEEYFEQGAYEG